MDFALSEERRMLQETIDRFISDRYNVTKRLQMVETDKGFDQDLWSEFADLGVIGALLPPEAGGFGGLGEDLTVVFESLGRGLVVEPFLATAVLGAGCLHLVGGQEALLEKVISGEVQLAFAHAEPSSRYDQTQVETIVSSLHQLTGRKAVVMNAPAADYLIVSARHEGDASDSHGIGLYLVKADAEGLDIRGYGTIDAGRAGEVTLHNTPAICLMENAFSVIEEVMAKATLCLCAEAMGAMEFAKDSTLEYLKTRKQFGRNLGSFQALQHRMVELVIECEQSRSAMMLASAHLEHDRIEREKLISAAKYLVGRTAKLCSEETIQMHGGIAMCWEYDVAHYAKRLVMIDHQLGDSDHHLDRFIAFSGDA
ncbi:MAG: pimeloyl-CoA dehydrogenase small subunit [Alphaproteobacteria bacterium]|nr:pimeloyl-CoA dehydrogenase small subunit [Alphaproteobacteria bacterium]